MIGSKIKTLVLALFFCICTFSFTCYAEDEIESICLGPAYYTSALVPSVSVEDLYIDDGFVFHEEIPMDEELQHYLWKKCKEIDMKYCFALGILQRESEFRASATHKNSGGSVDRGIAQINSCWIKKFKKLGLISCTEDLYDPYKCIDCAMYLLSDYVAKFGNCEKVYAVYNTGNERINSNKNSRIVVQYWEAWKSLFGDI